jgi:hypothetical protein
MGDDTDSLIAGAEARGERVQADEPRAVSARYETKTGRVHVELANGCGLACSPGCSAHEPGWTVSARRKPVPRVLSPRPLRHGATAPRAGGRAGMQRRSRD